MPDTNEAAMGGLTAARSEVQSLARQAAEAGCPWALPDLQTYFDECVETQRCDTTLLPVVVSYWRRRFESAIVDPGQRRPAYISLLQAREVVRTSQSRLQNLMRRDPQRIRGLLERLEAASDEREKALLLLSAEAAAAMLPPGLVLNEAPTPPLREAENLLRQLRSSGLALGVTNDGKIAISGGSLSGSQRERLRVLRAEVAQLISAPPTEIV